jgi:FkbM family methyltransferase
MLVNNDGGGTACETSVYQQESDLTLALALADHVSSRSLVDVGAEKGGFSRPFIERGFECCLLEPFTPHLGSLRALANGTNSKVFDVAVDDSDREGILHIAHSPDGATMDYFHSLHRDDRNPYAKHVEARTVSCRSLGSLAREGAIPLQPGFLKIDTEGCDLRVIRGMECLRPEVLICEYVTPSLYPTWKDSFPEPLFATVMALGYEECIAVKRFDRHELVEICPPGFVDGQWGNLIFLSSSLLRKARSAIDTVIFRSELSLVASCRGAFRSLEEKEAFIQQQNVWLEEHRKKNDELREEKMRLKEKIEELRRKLDKNH